jgi:hypothetical protein
VRTQEKHSEKRFTVGEIGEGDTPPAAIPTLPPTAAVGKRRPDASVTTPASVALERSASPACSPARPYSSIPPIEWPMPTTRPAAGCDVRTM